MTKLLKILFTVFSILFSVAYAEKKAQSPIPPSASVPEMRSSETIAICIDCYEPFFDTETHKEVLQGLLNNIYIAELRKALYWQDTYHQFESKAHYDNCDFDSATGYIAELQSEVGLHVENAKKAKLAGKTKDVHKAVKKAFFALGQAIHAIQDFYAHTNYVELKVPNAKKIKDLKVIKPWLKNDQEKIANLINEGLISGYVFWGFPQKCPSGTISHGDLAKDSAKTKSGKVLIPHLKNQSQYNIAKLLAREASIDFLKDAFKSWPLLKEINGSNVAFEVMVDRRNI